MKKIAMITFLTVVSSSSLALAAPGEPYSDEWIRGRISGAFAYNTALDSSELDVSSNGGNVTLKGKVATPVEKEFAEAIAKASDGVKSVDNQISIDQSIASQSRSGFGQKLKDAGITASVKSKLLANKNTEGSSIHVETQGNVVKLSGDVRSEAEKVLAERITERTSGVRTVNNQLTVVTDSARARLGESKDMPTAISDAWISTKVRSMLAFDSDYTGSDVKVTTTNGAVRLDGYAQSKLQKAMIEESVREVNGVKSVESKLLVIRDN